MLDFTQGASLWVSSLCLSAVQHVTDLFFRLFHGKILFLSTFLCTQCAKQAADPVGCRRRLGLGLGLFWKRKELFILYSGTGYNVLPVGSPARMTTCSRAPATWLQGLSHRGGVCAGESLHVDLHPARRVMAVSLLQALRTALFFGYSRILLSNPFLADKEIITAVFLSTVIYSAECKNVPFLQHLLL